jgi:ribosomal-protein-alanine N-acetyltransferase
VEILGENEELYLRRFQLSDAPSLFELESDPAVYRYLHQAPMSSLEEVKAIIEHVKKQYHSYGTGRLAVIRKTDEALLGWAGLKYETKIRDFNYYDLGYRLKQKYWRQGYGKQAAQLSLQYGFELLGLDTICGATDVENIGSNKILQQLGMQEKQPFEFEGIPCRWYEINKADYFPLDT